MQPFSFPSKEPWTLNPPKIILDLHKKQSEVESHVFKNAFLEIKSIYKHHLSMYTDGSKQDEKIPCAVISPDFTDSIRLPDNSSIFTTGKKVRETSRECHNHKPQAFPDTKRKSKPTNPNKPKSNKRTKSTKISSLFPRRGNRNAKRTEKQKNKMTQGKT